MNNKNSFSFEENINSILVKLIEVKKNSRNPLLNPMSALNKLYTEFDGIIDKSENLDSNTVLKSINGINDWLEKVYKAKMEYETCSNDMERLNEEIIQFSESMSQNKDLGYSYLLKRRKELDQKSSEFRTQFEECEKRNIKILRKYEHFKETIKKLQDIYGATISGRKNLKILRLKKKYISTLILLLKLIGALSAAFFANSIFKLMFADDMNRYAFLITGILAFSLENILAGNLIIKMEEKSIWRIYDRIVDELIESVEEIVQHYETLRSLASDNNRDK